MPRGACYIDRLPHQNCFLYHPVDNDGNSIAVMVIRSAGEEYGVTYRKPSPS